MTDNIYTPGTSQIVANDGVAAAGLSQQSISRVLPRYVSTGSTRGTQTVGYGNVQIDGSNNRITLGQSTTNGAVGATIVVGQQSSTSTQTGVSSSSLASNNQGFGLSVTDINGNTLAIGILSDGTLGMSITDPSGFLLFKLNGQTWFWYDKNHNVNVMQVGLKPDTTYGFATAAVGDNVSQGYS